LYPVYFARLLLDEVTNKDHQFNFRPRLPQNGKYFVELSAAGSGAFKRTIQARPGTTDMACVRDIFARGSYDLRALARYNDICALYREDSLIFDLGAYAGYSCVYFASQWPLATVVAVEPDFDNYSLLMANTRGLPVHTVHAAAGKDGWARVSKPVSSGGLVGIQTAAVAEGTRDAVKTFSVSNLLSQYKHLRPFICKVDIEGAESDLFADAAWVDEFPVIIVELHDWLFPTERRSRAFLSAVANQDRDFVLLGENIVSVKNH
jgi:FkbM family methyltransferase